MNKEECTTPCLCNTCLEARDKEIRRVKKQLIVKIKGEREEIKMKEVKNGKGLETYCGNKDCGNHTLCAWAIGRIEGKNQTITDIINLIK